MNKFYITTAIPYVNAAPHIGHALEFIQADTITRYHKLLGEETCLLSGGDENALKNVQAAEKVRVPLQEFIDKNAKSFEKLAQNLNVKFDIFQKGSSKNHYLSSQELWTRCKKNHPDDIYQHDYEGLYCVGCEAFYAQDELDEKGECFEHPGKKLEKVKEKNWFFRLSKYRQDLIAIIKGKHKDYPQLEIIPKKREHEILSFLERSDLQDISISRSNERAKNWGVPVPGDNTQRIYVWFDALNIYQSGIGFGWDYKKYEKWWPADVHVIGKGITRFHAVYWPAFLLSAGLKLPKKIYAHGYITIEGQKMSKTIGNVIDPIKLIEKYGVDSIRYYLLREIPAHDDGDFSERRFKELYNADLANNLGNLVSRVARLAANNKFNCNLIEQNTNKRKGELSGELYKKIQLWMFNFQFDKALEDIWRAITELNQYIDRGKPWAQKGGEITKTLTNIIVGTESTTSIREIANALTSFLPQTAEKILQQFTGPMIKSQPPLFPRINT